jgi:hypothetical protein
LAVNTKRKRLRKRLRLVLTASAIVLKYISKTELNEYLAIRVFESGDVSIAIDIVAVSGLCCQIDDNKNSETK